MKKILTIFSFVFLTGCSLGNLFGKSVSTKQLVLQTAQGKTTVTVEVADEEKEREIGLMNRQDLDTDKGMWFVFQDEAPRVFWMKNTLIPLDVIFFNSKKEVVNFVPNMEPCKVPQCPSYASGTPAMYALEVKSGFAQAKGLKVGDKIVEE